MKTAFITGFSGQDGTFLTRYLLDQGYKVIGLTRRISTEPPRRVRGEFDFGEELASGKLVLEEGDLLSPRSLNAIIMVHQPDEIYNLAAQSHVGVSFTQPEFTMATIIDGTVNLITALESCHAGQWKMYQASTSEMFGNRNIGVTLDEHSEYRPNSPYAIAKTAAHFYCQMKCKEGRFISCGILFNHESEIRGGNFVTQKIANGVAQYLKDRTILELGNIDSGRDWGFAGDYVEAMHLMLQQEKPDDYIVSTGKTHTVREFVEIAFANIGVEIEWFGDGTNEIGKYQDQEVVKINARFYRPADVNYLNGDSQKIRDLGWKPKVGFEELITRMVKAANEKSQN